MKLYRPWAPGTFNLFLPDFWKSSPPGNPALLTVPIFGWEETLEELPIRPWSQRGCPRALGLAYRGPEGNQGLFFPGWPLEKYGAPSHPGLGTRNFIPCVVGAKCRSSSCSKCKKWEEPFSSSGLAKHRLPGLAASLLDSQLPVVRHTVPACSTSCLGQGGPSTLPWPWAVCLRAASESFCLPDPV